MSGPFIGQRCERLAHQISCSGLKRLRLSHNEYRERLTCRYPGRSIWSASVLGGKSASGRSSTQVNGRRSLQERSRCRSKTTSLSRSRRPIYMEIAPATRLSTSNTFRSFSTSHPTRNEPPTPSLSSVSASEVSHFSSLAASWWDPHGPSRLLHLMNPLRHDFIRSCLSSTTPDTTSIPFPPPHNSISYLDIGCGGGIFSSSATLLPTTSSVTAIDPTPACILAANAHARTDPALSPPPNGKLTYLNTSIEDLPQDFKAVDIITLFEVIEHIDSPSAFLDQAMKHLKSGGWLIGSTIARHPISYITTKLIAEAPVFGVVPRGTHDWNKYINPSELRQYFDTRAKGNWGEFKVQGVVYVPMLGWQVVDGSENVGNYFFGVQKLE